MNNGNLRSSELGASPLAIEQALTDRWPPELWRDTRLLVAVSGGADSVALVHALVRLSRMLSESAEPAFIDAAHFNHGWRGAESDADELFVTRLCQRLGVRLFTGRDLSQAGGSISKTEESARELRYQFLTKTAYACGARYVVTGHTANDRVETVLHNLFRGTGLSGVAGPTLTRQLDQDLVLVRPLIGVWRQQIEDYLNQLQEQFRSDSSNTDTTYTRNFLRHSMLPLLRNEFGEQVDQRLWSFSELAEEALSALRDSAAEYLRLVDALRRDAGLVGDAEGIWLPILSQLDFPWVVVREGLRSLWITRNWKLQPMTRDHWEGLRALLQAHPSEQKLAVAKNSTLNLPGGLIAVREGEWVRIGK